MNLYLRLLITLFRAWRSPQMDIEAEITRTFRVLPNDIDVNLHMNNGRYLSVTDLLTIEFFMRTGFLRTLLRNKWYPVLGGSIITYRRELALGEKYTVTYRWTAHDEHWNFLKFEFRNMKGQLCAAGYSKGAAKSGRGIVPMEKALEKLGMDPQPREIPPAVAHWLAGETEVISNTPKDLAQAA